MPGANGVSVTSATLPSGDSHCPAGGSSFTSANGDTYACNGAAGTGSADTYDSGTFDLGVSFHVDSSPTILAYVLLPAGNYLVMGRARFTVGANALCVLNHGSDRFDFTTAFDVGSAPGTGYVSLQDAVALSTPDQVNLICHTFGETAVVSVPRVGVVSVIALH
jgi:hypothetical protein